MQIVVVALHRPIEPTGVCRHAANLARCLARMDEVTQISFVTGAWQQHYFQTALLGHSPKIQLLSISIDNTAVSRNLWFLFGLPKLANQLQADLVHLTFPLPFIRSLFSCPIVSTIHDLYPYKIPENFGRKQAIFNRLFLDRCIAKSDGLACISQTTLADLEYYFPKISHRKHTKVIYNSIDFDRVEMSQPQALEITTVGAASPSKHRPFILCVGQHRQNKNFDLAIAAIAKSIGDGTLALQTQLVIVGSVGPETDNLHRAVATHSLAGSVLFLSGINDRELCWLYHHCALTLVPSAVEGFCLPLVEALYFSSKVVCSDIPIFREIGSANCTYFDLAPDPIDNIAKAIEIALSAEVSTEPYDLTRFSQTVIAERYLHFYHVVRHHARDRM